MNSSRKRFLTVCSAVITITAATVVPTLAQAPSPTPAPAPTATATVEKYLLRHVHAIGDVVEENSSMNMTLTVNASLPKQKLPPFKFSNSSHERLREEVLAVTPKGDIDGVRRTYTINRKTDTEQGKAPQVIVSSLEGKTVAVRRQNGRTVVTLAKGNLAAKDRADLMKSFGKQNLSFFPAHKVAVGEEWKVPAQTAKAIFDGGDSASATGKLLEFVTYENHRCARIRITFDVAMKLENSPHKMTMTLSGDLYHSMDIERAISMQADGTIKMSGTEYVKEGKLTMFGTGAVKMAMTYDWLKVGGKSIVTETVVVQ